MKIVHFELNGIETSGVLRPDEVIAYHSDARLSIEDFIAGEDEAVRFFSELDAGGPTIKSVALSDVRLLAPIRRTPNNVFCVGLNYQNHVDEGKAITTDKLSFDAPVFFTKSKNTIGNPFDPIPYWTHVTEKLDYEIELAVILGKGGRDIPKGAAMDHIFGYCVANDVSARDTQFRHGQWFKGKSLDGSLPLGPWIVTRDEVSDPATLILSLSVNGEERQRAAVSQMIFDIPTLIEQLSAGLTLSAGDVILSGTPSGVGAALNPPRYLQDGDEIVGSISGLGSLKNRVVAQNR